MKYFLKNYLGDVESTLRYLPIAVKMRAKSGSILEIGSGDFGITRYLNKKITGADIKEAFSDQKSPLIDAVVVNGVKLPFKDNSFDYVISVDMLEHITANDRVTSINEMVRIAKKGIFIAVPIGKLSEAQDEYLNSLYQKIHGHDYHFLKEHLSYKLPELKFLTDTLNDAAKSNNKKISIDSHPHFNLTIRRLLMTSWIKNGLAWRLIFKSFGILIPFHPLLNFGDCYRVLLTARISKK